MSLKQQIVAGVFLSAWGAIAMAQTIVGVSWSNFQEERWKTDEAAIKAQLAKIGGSYVSADAGGSPRSNWPTSMASSPKAPRR